MIIKLTDQVWWGNWQAPAESAGQVKCIINVAHSFGKRRGRNVYWANLEQVPWETIYFRFAKKDRQDVTPEYLEAIATAADTAERLGKLPILTHCQMGGHRGPTSAIFVAWHLGGRERGLLNHLHARALSLFPRLANGSNYYQSTMAYCKQHARDYVEP